MGGGIGSLPCGGMHAAGYGITCTQVHAHARSYAAAGRVLAAVGGRRRVRQLAVQVGVLRAQGQRASFDTVHAFVKATCIRMQACACMH